MANKSNRPVAALQLQAIAKTPGSGVQPVQVTVPFYLNESMPPKALECFREGFKALIEEGGLNTNGNPIVPVFHTSGNTLTQIGAMLADGQHILSASRRTVWANKPQMAGDLPPDIEDESTSTDG